MELSSEPVVSQSSPSEERQKIISNDLFCIGPPDLVSAPKVHSKKTNSKINFYVCGFQTDKFDCIFELFDNVIKMQPKGIFKKHKYEITEMNFSTWNSFENYDVTFSIKLNDKNIEYEITGKEKSLIDLQKMFQEIKLSQALRYWYLPKNIFNLQSVEKKELKIFRPCNFSNDEILYIAENHPYSNEVELAIANYLISLGDFAKIKEIFLMIIKKLPKTICHIFNILSKFPKFKNEICELLIESYKHFPDDILIAYNYILLSSDISEYANVVPLFMNGFWFSPIGCACMSHLIMKSETPEDAIFCLNAAFYSKTNLKNGKSHSIDFSKKKIKKTDKTISSFEKDLISYLSYDHRYHIYDELNELTKAVSQIRIRTILNDMLSSKQDTHYTDFEFRCPSRPPPSTDNLYDPGISSSTALPAFIKTLPLSSEFYDIANDFFDDVQFKDRILRVKKLINESEALKALSVSVRLRNAELYSLALSDLRSKRKLRPIYQTLCLHFGLSAPDLSAAKPKPTNHEQAFLSVARELFAGIAALAP